MTASTPTDEQAETSGPVQLEAPASPSPAPLAPPTRSVQPLALIIGLLALGLAIGLSAAAYFTWHQIQLLSQQQAGIQDSVSERMQPLRSSLEAVERRLGEDQQQAATRFERLTEDQRSVGQRLNVLAALLGRSERGWSLAEVEYLLRIANQRLQLQRDLSTALQALQAADERLRDLADPHYGPVREQIARDVDAIRSVPAVDVDGLVAQLGVALERLDDLPVAGSHYEAVASGDEPAEDRPKTAQSVQELPALVWGSLSGLFRVREHDQAVGPMLPPESAYFLRENLRLQLSAARLALLRSDRAQYQAALRTAAAWLSDYFAVENDAVQQLIGRLHGMADENILPPVPDVSASLSLLLQQMQLSEQQPVLPSVPADTSAESGQ
jgi:uroporphyrin-3 C-methyltransferase